MRGILITSIAAVCLVSCGASQPTSSNAMHVIEPYRHAGTWVFDDSRVGLVREPFVAGTPALIDKLVADVSNAQGGFRLLFSGDPFPGHTHEFHRGRAEGGGYWYRSDDFDAEGWLCPALFKYFRKAPATLYVKAEAK